MLSGADKFKVKSLALHRETKTHQHPESLRRTTHSHVGEE